MTAVTGVTRRTNGRPTCGGARVVLSRAVRARHGDSGGRGDRLRSDARDHRGGHAMRRGPLSAGDLACPEPGCARRGARRGAADLVSGTQQNRHLRLPGCQCRRLRQGRADPAELVAAETHECGRAVVPIGVPGAIVRRFRLRQGDLGSHE